MEEFKIKKVARSEKTDLVRNKLTKAMETILEKYDYDTLTIRNICAVSGVSYGSFYNVFDSKESFLTYYLTNDFIVYMNDYLDRHPEFETKNPIDKMKELFVCCGYYNLKRGLQFISGFYSPRNHSLSPINKEGERGYSFTPLVGKSHVLLEEARKEGLLSENTDIERIPEDICHIFNGVTFNWCISNGRLDMIGVLRESLEIYIKTISKQ